MNNDYKEGPSERRCVIICRRVPRRMERRRGEEERPKFGKRNLFPYTKRPAACLEFYATAIRYSGFSFAKLHARASPSYWRERGAIGEPRSRRDRPLYSFQRIKKGLNAHLQCRYAFASKIFVVSRAPPVDQLPYSPISLWAKWMWTWNRLLGHYQLVFILCGMSDGNSGFGYEKLSI